MGEWVGGLGGSGFSWYLILYPVPVAEIEGSLFHDNSFSGIKEPCKVWKTNHLKH